MPKALGSAKERVLPKGRFLTRDRVRERIRCNNWKAWLANSDPASDLDGAKTPAACQRIFGNRINKPNQEFGRYMSNIYIYDMCR